MDDRAFIAGTEAAKELIETIGVKLAVANMHEGNIPTGKHHKPSFMRGFQEYVYFQQTQGGIYEGA